ncbi:MAG: hypothetical protein IJT44_05755 [Clostridia bacterium]|nr:hypothetical protein [Clostridia bacterium]
MGSFDQEREKYNFCETLALELPDRFDLIVDGNVFDWEIKRMEMFRHERFPVFFDCMDYSRFNHLLAVNGEPTELSWYAIAASANGALDISVKEEFFTECWIRCTEMNDAFAEDILAAAQSFYQRPLLWSLKTEDDKGSKVHTLTLRFADEVNI